MTITAQMRTDVAGLYTALFARAPERDGLGYWVSKLDTGSTVAQVAQSMYNVDAARSTYPLFLTNQEIVAKFYVNVLGRTADADGSAYWTAKLNAGTSKGQIISEMITAVSAYTGTDPAALTSQALFTNKVAAGLYYAVNDNGNDPTFATTLLTTITALPASVTAANLASDAAVAAANSQALTLTTGVDTFVGGSGNDTVNGVVGTNTLNIGNGGVLLAAATLTGIDTLDGGAGSNILNIVDQAGNTAITGFNTKNFQTLNVNSVGSANVDTTSGLVGVTTINVVNSVGADTIKAAAGQAVNVVDTAGKVTINGVSATQTVTTSGGYALSGATGTVAVTDKAQGAIASTIDGGSTVNLTTTTKAAGGSITIGATTAATGAVTVVDNINSATAGASLTGGAIAVTGGTAVTVTTNATQTLSATAGTNGTVTQAAVNVTGSSATTAVIVNQTAVATAANTILAVAGVVETTVVQFGQMTAGDTLTLAGVTYTATTGGATAKQVAAAFANLSNGIAVGFTSSAVTGAASDTVAFTSTGSGNVTDLNAVASAGLVNTSTTSTAETYTTTTGIAAVTAAGKSGIVAGGVTINDATAGTAVGTITNVTLSSYANSSISSSALTTLSLSGKSGTLGLTSTGATTLDLTLNALAVNTSNAITESSNHYAKVNIHTTGAASTLSNFTDSAATALTLDGTQALTLTSAAGLSALKTITISGAAGLTVGAGTLAASVTDINASATTGNVSASINATTTTYEGGAGNDTVTIAAAPTKAISGGTGVDTLVLNVAAATFSNPSSNTLITGFETLGLGAAATGTTYDATGFIHLTEGGVTAAVGFTNVAAGTDLTITASPVFATSYALKDATGTADALTLNLKGLGSIVGGTVTANGIESVSLSSTDTTTGAVAGGTGHSLTLVDNAATSITITGNTTLTLTSANTTVTSVDASAMTGGLIYTTAGTTAEVVKGGASANTLTAATGTVADTLIGGAGNDQLTANGGLDTLTGGGGNDLFIVATPSANLNSYATITDANAGDTLVFANKGIEVFAAAAISLAGTAVFQDFANAAINAGGNAGTNGYIAWFQYLGNTYVVESLHNAAVTPDFQNGTDLIVKLTGLVDLSTATLLQNGGTPEIFLH